MIDLQFIHYTTKYHFHLIDEHEVPKENVQDTSFNLFVPMFYCSQVWMILLAHSIHKFF